MTQHLATRGLRTVVLGSALVLALSGLGIGAAQADDQSPDPSSPSSPAAPGTSPSGDPTGQPGDGASQTPTPTPKPSQTPKKAAAKVNMCAQLPKPACSNPRDDVLFNYPFSSTYRYAIRNQVTRLVNSVPGTHEKINRPQLRIAMFSLNDDTLVNALIKAYQRGVSVQVVVNSHNVTGNSSFPPSPSFKRLMKYLGTTIGTTDPQSPNYFGNRSWARICSKSCRGSGGNVHYKMILASDVVRTDGTTVTKNVTMAGSPNLTLKAAQGQWNHFYTYVDNTPGAQTYNAYSRMFFQMSLDKAISSPYRQYGYGTSTDGDFRGAVPLTYFYPKPGTTANHDPSLIFFKDVKCTGADPAYSNNGRTVIRIGQYAWYEERGVWFAKRIRQLWDAGCDVSIETSIMGNTVKSILLSSRGRGRIPIRQLGTQDSKGNWITYDHAKWASISGYVGNSRGAVWITQGTVNWSNLALSSDDFMQQFKYNSHLPATGIDSTNSREVYSQLYQRFYANYKAIWSGPHSRALSPASRIPGDVGGKNARLGQGKYSALEPD